MKKILIICLCMVIFGHGAKLSEVAKRQMDKVLEQYVSNNISCKNLVSDWSNLRKQYGRKKFRYLRNECNNYYWSTTEDCLYCGRWGGPMGRGYGGYFLVSSRGVMSLSIWRNATPTDETLHECKNIKYRVKEELSPIHVVLETEPDEDGGYCIGKEIWIRVNDKVKSKGSIHYGKRGIGYLVLSKVNKFFYKKFNGSNFKSIGMREIGNQKKFNGIYEKVFEDNTDKIKLLKLVEEEIEAKYKDK